MSNTENAGIYYPPKTGVPQRNDLQLMAESVDSALMLSKPVQGAMAGGHTGTVTFRRLGRLVIPTGGIIRQAGSSQVFTRCAYIPVGFRPLAVYTYPETPAWGNNGEDEFIYQLSVNPEGDINVRMSGAFTSAMSFNLSPWVTMQPMPPEAL